MKGKAGIILYLIRIVFPSVIIFLFSVAKVEEKTVPSGDESDADGSAYNSSSEGTGGGLAASGGSSVADIDAFADSLGVACVVCKSFDVQTGNTLVECQDCHSLYHQDCHRSAFSVYHGSNGRRV